MSIPFITDKVIRLLPQVHISKKIPLNFAKANYLGFRPPKPIVISESFCKTPDSWPTSSVEIDMGLRKKSNYLFHYGLRKHSYFIELLQQNNGVMKAYAPFLLPCCLRVRFYLYASYSFIGDTTTVKNPKKPRIPVTTKSMSKLAKCASHPEAMAPVMKPVS